LVGISLNQNLQKQYRLEFWPCLKNKENKMKLLATAIFTGMLTFGTVACAKEEPKKATPAATQTAPATSASDKKDEAPKTKN
jgi:hypothetical protein